MRLYYYMGRLVVLFIGFILLIVGIALGVTMVMLPIGFPMAILGILAILGASVGWDQ